MRFVFFGVGKRNLAGLWPNELKLGEGGQRPATTIYYYTIYSDHFDRLILNRVKLVSPEILHMSFFEAVVDTLCTRRVGILLLAQMKSRTSCLLCNSTRIARMERGDGRWTVRWKRSRVKARQGGGSEAGEEAGSEVERTKEERKEEARQGGGREVGPLNEARHSRRRVLA